MVKNFIISSIKEIKERGLINYSKEFLFQNKTTKQTIMKNTFWLFLGEGINKGLMFLLTILIARYLGAEGYGRFSFALSFVSLFAVLADFGLSTLTIREVARDKKLVKKYVDNIAVIKLILGLVTFALIFTIIQFMGKTAEVRWLVYLFAIYMIINSFSDFFRAVFRAFEKMQYEAISKIVQGTALFGAAIFFILAKYSVYWILFSYLAAACVGLIVTLLLVHIKFNRFNINLNFKLWKGFFRESWPFAMTIMFTLIYVKIDVVMITYFLNYFEAGIYSGFFLIISLFILIMTIFTQVIFPVLARKKDRQLYIKLYALFFLTSLFFFLISNSFRKFLIFHILGHTFFSHFNTYLILTIAMVFIIQNTYLINILNANNKQREVTKITGIVAFFNVATNFFFIPLYGILGAALTTLMSEAIVYAYSIYLLTKLHLL